MRRSLCSIALAISLLVLATTPSALAQEATPAGTPGAGAATSGVDPEFPLVADPALCTVEPRDPQALLDIWFPADGTPVTAPPAAMATAVTIPLGEPLEDPTVLAGITATVHEVFSCFAAGDFVRATALFTDDLTAQFGPAPGESREDVAAFLEASPVPETDADPEQSQILAITDVTLLDDGRVGAFVVDEVGTAYVIFEQTEDRWLVDEVIEFSAGSE